MMRKAILIIGILTLVHGVWGVPGGLAGMAYASEDPAEANRSYFLNQFGFTLENVFWGEFHSHTKYSTDAAMCGALTPDKAYKYARDTAHLHFVGLNDHAEEQNQKAIPKKDQKAGLNNWQSVLKTGKKYNNENSSKGKVFIVFPVWEYTNTHGLPGVGGSVHGYGHKNVAFKNLNPDVLPPDEYGAFNVDSEYLAENASDLWEKLDVYRPSCEACEGRAITIVHTPAHVGEGYGDAQDHRTDWSFMDRDFVRNVEIYSKWGSSEGPSPSGEGCPAEELFEYTSSEDGDPLSVRSALFRFWVQEGDGAFLLSFVGGTDNHMGQPGNASTNQCNFPFRGGITGIVAPSLTRNDLWSNLWNRHTLATSTGGRMAMLMAAETNGNHFFMGDQGIPNETVRVRVLSTSDVEKLELIVDGCVHTTVTGYALDVILNLDSSRHYIYARASLHDTTGDLLHAWTSPIYMGMPGK